MCGLVGTFGEPSELSKKAFFDLLVIDTIRGFDSTGVALVNKGAATARIFKMVAPPQYLIHNPNFQKGFVNTPVYMFLGHNRNATVGEVSTRNAHPFRENHITLAHNGTLNSTYSLEKDCEKDRKFETDSEAITWSVARKGIDETWRNIFGAAALTFWDSSKAELNLITDGKRPLAYGPTKDGKHIIWASETWMIAGMALRHNLMLEKIVNLTPDVLYTFKVDSTWTVSVEQRKLSTSPSYPRHYHSAPWTGDSYEVWADRYDLQEDNRQFGAWQRKSLPAVVKEAVPSCDVPKSPVPDLLQVRSGHNFSHMIAYRKVSKKDFLQKYDECIYCDKPLDYQQTVILDEDQEIACCSGCALRMEREGLSLDLYKSM